MGTLPDVPPGSNAALAESSAKMWWDRNIFFSDEEASAGTCPSVIDVTGRARILVYGPYRELTPGVWRATAFLHLSPDAALRRLAVQFGAEPHYLTADLPIGAPGDHQVELTLAVREAHPHQIRVLLKKAAFHGELSLAGVSMERIADLPPEGRA